MQVATKDNGMDTLREYAKGVGAEPSSFINALSDSTGKALWLLDKELIVVWHSDNTNALTACVGPMCGLEYAERMPELPEVFREVCTNKTTTSSFISGGREYEVISHPINTKDGVAGGYIVTLSKGYKTRLSKLLEKNEKRNNDICSVQQTLSLPLD